MATPTTAAFAPVTSAGSDYPMRAIVQTQWGTADVLHPASVERPTIADDEVLIEVHAAGLDRGTWHLMTGYPYAIRLAGFGFRRPKNPIPGFDVAGVVVGFGPKVTGFKQGDEVYGVGKGTFAEFTAAKASKLARKPANVSFEQAAAAPVSGSTALKAIDIAKVTAGQRVLVIGASGGVGSYAVQIAKALGAHVTGVASTSKLDLVRSLGADEVVDYTRQDVTSGSASYDVILDIGGNTKVKRLRRVLTKTGTLVIVGGEHGGSWTGGMHRQFGAVLRSMVSKQTLTTFVGKETTEGLERLAVLLEAGSVVPAIERTFPLDQAPDAMRHLAAGHARGKLVITP
jgi:NADPH:quinone reductase-like Zn-dependent oxidoreductase